MDEKRNFTRVLFRAETTLRLEDKVIRGQLSNLSLRGMLVNSPDSFPVGAPVAAQLKLTGSTSEVFIRLMGRVIRHEESALAVEFTGVDLDSFILLKNVILYNGESEDRVVEEFNRYMQSASDTDS